MRPSFRVLSVVVATACLGLSTLAPVTAFADDGDDGDDDASSQILPVPTDLVFTSATAGSVTISYSCTSADGQAPELQDLDVSLQLAPGKDKQQIAQGQVQVLCDGAQASTDVPLTAVVDVVPAGAAYLRASIADDDGALQQQVRVVRSDQPADQTKAPVRLTTQASPDSVKQGKKITVKGTVSSGRKRFKAEVELQFAADGGDFVAVGTVRSSAKGKLSTSVKATTSGTFRYSYAGNETTQGAVSAGDHVVVKVKHKKHH